LFGNPASAQAPMIDPFGRAVTYLRVSVTDRCDFRCTYCMAENMTFLPKKDLLTLEELERLCSAFIAKGVRKLRLTGGEPLVRKNIMFLVEALGKQIDAGRLDELTLTTNGSQLARYAQELHDNGVRRINVSLDTLDEAKFKAITRWGNFRQVMNGIDAAQKAGIKIKLNAVALKDFNEHEIPEMIRFAHGRDMDLTLIETMPMGEIEEDRTDRYLPLSQVRESLEDQFTLSEIPYKTGGPARYVEVKETNGRLGFITPMTHNFCEAAIAYVSPAPALSTCVSARTTPRTCVPPCAAPTMMITLPMLSMRLSPASRKAMTSSSTALTNAPPSRDT